MKFFTEKARLLTWLSVLMGMGFLAVSLVGYFVSAEQIRYDIAAQQLPLTGDNIYSELQKDLFRPIFISSLMASDTFMRDWVLDGEQELEAIIRYLKEVRQRYRTITSFFVSERTRIYYHADGMLKTVQEDDPRDVWYFRVRKMTEPYEINVDPDLANRDAMTIFINYRVLDYDGNFLGAAGVGLTMDAVRQLIDSYEKRFARRIFFVDAQGRITLASYSMNHLRQGIRLLPGLSQIADEILRPDPNPRQLRYELEGSTVQVNTRFIPEFNWSLVVEQTEDPSLQAVRRVLWGNLGVSALITVLVLLIVRYTVGFFQARLEKMATTDKLTGLLNRGALEIIFAQQIRDQARNPYPLSAIMLDIDHFKEVNDRHGHLTGDQVLTKVAEAARQCLRASDVLARWGGEEFLALAQNCSLGDAAKLAEKMRAHVQTSRLLPPHDQRPLTVSLGVAQFSPGESLDDMLHRVDQALYQAKQEGRNRVVAV